MHIRASVFPIPPYVFPPKDVENSFTGPIPNLLETLSRRMNFTYDLSMPPDHCSVSLQLANGSWTSFRGMIQRNQTDIVFGPEVLVEEQLQGVKFGNYYFIFTVVFFASAGDSEAVDFSKLILAFDKEIWYVLISFIFILSMSVTLFDVSDQVLRGKGARNKFATLEINFWMFLATFFLEGTPRMPELHKSRLVFGVWLMAVLIMMNAFSCQFKTALMIKGADDTMYTVKDLSKRPDLTIYFRKSGYLEKFFEESPLEEYRKLWENIVANGKIGIQHINFFYERDLYDKVKAGKGVLMAPAELAKIAVQGVCPTMVGKRRFYFLKEPAFSNIFAYYATPHFPDKVLREINKRVKWIVEAQIFNRWVELYHKDYERHCLTDENAQNDNPEMLGLTLEHILPIVYITFVMQGFALFVLVVEIFSHYFSKYKIKKRVKKWLI